MGAWERPGRALGQRPLAPAGLQYTDQLPGGALQLHIYGGADGTFTLVEDDGETEAYRGKSSTRDTAFLWDNDASTLTWTVTGDFMDSHTFLQLEATLFVKGADPKVSPVTKLQEGGSVSFSSS